MPRGNAGTPGPPSMAKTMAQLEAGKASASLRSVDASAKSVRQMSRILQISLADDQLIIRHAVFGQRLRLSRQLGCRPTYRSWRRTGFAQQVAA
eukprot:Skav216022  [mRNA]  locus=scaffold417:88015:88296:+ [translate_table: standard]